MNANDYQAEARRKRRGDWMQTYTGKAFWPIDPHVDDVDIIDIAQALSKQCRYAGHCLGFYSVAEHSCHISDRCPDDVALWGLLHDASEAYLSDVIRPIKPYLLEYSPIETKVMRIIAQRFQLIWPMPAEVKRLDAAILGNEMHQIMADPPRDWQLKEPPIDHLVIAGWQPAQAYDEFMARFGYLTGEKARVDQQIPDLPWPLPGDRDTCKMCGQPITYIDPNWDHPGEIKPRHPAMPVRYRL